MADSGLTNGSDRLIVDTLKNGLAAEVSAIANDGVQIRIRSSLRGLSASLAHIEQICR